ncbi:hypothetical protein NW752_003452 [Fusarium irregulare]|nr:hypothetical protein NW752_003452 [Fusarium irregulare]
MDVSRTSSRIALSLDALKAQISFAIADDNRQSLAVYLDDGRITVDEVGCWTLWPSDSLLHNAIMRRAFNCMDLLLERGSDPCARSDKNRDAVLLSGELENLDLLEVLVRHGVSLLSVDEYGCNIWHLAAESFLKESRDYRNVLFGTHFQESQKGILMKNIDGRTPLDLALNLANSITDEEIVLELISHCGNAPFFWENNGPIFPTAFNFQSEAAIRLLLQYRLDSEQSGFNSAKPLHHLDKSVSLEWVRFLLTLYPEDHKSRHIGRLPVELYVDDCIRAAALPKNEILIELTFDGFFESCDDEGHDPWKFLCLAGERLGYSVLFNGWDALQSALGHYIQHGCLASYEDHNMEFGMQPLFEMLIDMAWQTDWPYPIMDIDILNRELALSRYWTPKSQSMIHFLKVAISRLDVDIVKTLLNNSVPVDCAEGDRGTTIQYILDGEVAVDLCSGAEGREILSAILNTQTLESLKACPVDDQKGGLLYNLIHRDWKEPDARWIVEQIVKKGVDIDGLVGSPTDAFGMTPLTWHLNHNSLAIAEVLVSMGASLNGTDYLPKNVNKFDVLRPVHACSRSGNVACLRRMFKLSQRTDVSVLWEATCRWQFNLRRGTLTETMTGFQISCLKGHLDCVSFFLEDVSVNNQFSSRGGCTALHFAAMGGDTVIIEQLIRYGFDIMAEDIEQMTPLHFAVQEHQTDAVSTLIKLGAESSVDKFGRTPLRLAELAGTEEVTNILRTRFQINGYASNDDKVTLTLLHHLKSAIELGDLPACQDLISQGCPLHIPIPRSGSLSVLAYSLVKDRIPIAEWLLQKGPSVLGAPTFAAISQDALMVASAARDPVISILLPNMLQLFDHLSRKSFDFVFQLVAQAARSENEAGLKAILVYLHTHTITSKVLAEFAIRHEKNDFNINYSLHRAVQKGHCGIVRLLLENGIPVDSINAYANTPLMFARTPEMVDLLVEFDASPTPLLTDCLAPSLHFWAKSSTQILERLLTAFQQRNGLSSMKWLDVSLKIYHDLEDPRADIEFEGCPLGSALMIASACGQLDSVKFLIRRNASVCYEGQVGRLSVFKVATSKAVRNWLLVGRFNDQQRIRDIAEHDEAKTNFWSGFVQARIILNGVQHVRYDESRLDCAKRFMAYKRALKGRVAPHVDGLTFNRHRKVPHGAFSRDGVVDA